MRSLAIVMALVTAILVSVDLEPAGALPPSPDSGAELAARWCADCHMEPDRAAPSFRAIAKRPAADIRAALSRPHARPMGGISLNRREIDDVAAYIKGLDH